MTHRACLAVLLVTASITGPAFALERIYLFRHAEKAEYWAQEPALEKFQPLSAAGGRRAEALADALAGEVGDMAVSTQQSEGGNSSNAQWLSSTCLRKRQKTQRVDR